MIRLSDIVLNGINVGSKIAFLGLVTALTVNSFNRLTEEKFGKSGPYNPVEVAGALMASYILAETTDKYKAKRKESSD